MWLKTQTRSIPLSIRFNLWISSLLNTDGLVDPSLAVENALAAEAAGVSACHNAWTNSGAMYTGHADARDLHKVAAPDQDSIYRKQEISVGSKIANNGSKSVPMRS